MQKSYLLLRNNKQSGPFTIEELTQLSLQSKDLIWIVGQSAGWRYPEEIDSLKAFIPEQKSPSPPPTTTNNTASAVNTKPETHSTFQEQNLPDSDQVKHIYVSLPQKTIVAAEASAVVQETTTELSFDERVEKMRQRIAAAESANSVKDEEEEVETKYSRSLDDIKAEYSNWMHTQQRKHKRKLSIKGKHVGVGLLSLLIIMTSFWTVKYFLSKPSQPALVNNEPVAPLLNEADYASKTEPSAVKSNKINFKTNKQNTTARRSDKKIQESPKQTVSIPPIEQHSVKQHSIESAEPPSTEKRQPIQVSKETAIPTNDKAASIVEQLQLKADYIAGQRQKGVAGLAVTLKNGSNQLMKVVAVDIVYFTAGMKEIDRKTLYFSNIEPGKSITHNAPANKQAEGAYAQLGLISSEEGKIFYATNK